MLCRSGFAMPSRRLSNVPHNPIKFYFSDDLEFIRQNQALVLTRTITKMQRVQDIVPILKRMKEFGIEEISLSQDLSVDNLKTIVFRKNKVSLNFFFLKANSRIFIFWKKKRLFWKKK